MEDYFSGINETLEEMTSYFSKLYSEHDATLKEYKAKLFEVNVKLDELTRTQNVYSLNTDYRKNVFSPIEMIPEESKREADIKNEIRTLKSQRDEYEYSINEETIYLKSIDKRIQKLNSSKISIGKLVLDFDRKESRIKEKEEAEKKAIERQREELERKIESESKNSIDKSELKKHLNKILMLESFDNTYYSTVLDKRIKNTINKNSRELEEEINSLSIDPGHSKGIIKDTISSQNSLVNIIEEQLSKMNNSIDEKTGIKNALSDYVFELREKNPSINFDLNVGSISHKPNYIRYYSIFRLLDIFVDNAIKHSNCSNIKITFEEDDDRYILTIKDDGDGLPSDYLTGSEWYSGINRAKEIVFLLSGEISIEDDYGTEVEIEFDYE